MGPARNSPLSNPFYTAASTTGASPSSGLHSGPVRKSPRSSLSGKESLGMIPSISSLRNQVDKISSNSPTSLGRTTTGFKRSPLPLSSSSALILPISENDNPMTTGKNYHGGAVARRKSPRKLTKFSSSMDRLHELAAIKYDDGVVVDEVEGVLEGQKALFAQRKRIIGLVDVGDLRSALYWLSRMIKETPENLLHWSDHYRLYRICSSLGQPKKLLLQALLKLPECQLLANDTNVAIAKPFSLMLCLLALELTEALEDWEALLKGSQTLETKMQTFVQQSEHRWEREQFPSGWVPTVDLATIKARIAYFRGKALRSLGDFEQAIEAFSRSTDCDPRLFSSVSELVNEANALIPSGQRRAYMESLSIDLYDEGGDFDVDELFANGQYTAVLKVTEPLFKESQNMAFLPDHRLLVLHLGTLLALKKTNDLFDIAHRLVDHFPQTGVAWYAVGLFYEGVGKFDDSRRYLMKACSKDENLSAAWLMLGHSFSRSGDHDQAVSAYALLARHLAPASIFPRIFLAMEFLKTRQPALATPYLLEAYNSDPTNPWVLNELGILYSLKKDFPRAIASLNSAAALLAQKEETSQGHHAYVDLQATVLGNLVSVRLKKLTTLEAKAIWEDLQEALRAAKAILQLSSERQTSKMINSCAAAFELAYQITDDLSYCSQAVDLYFRVLQFSPTDKIANEGYKRSLVAKVQSNPIPIVEDSGEEMQVETEELYMDVESSPMAKSIISDMAAPSSLRRKLTTLSFSRLDEMEVVLETPRPPAQEGDLDFAYRSRRPH